MGVAGILFTRMCGCRYGVVTLTLLAIDPSSTCTGFALLSEKHELLDYGVWRPSRKDDPYVRIKKMYGEMALLLNEYPVQHVVLEVTSGHVSSRHAGTGAGLATYGVAVGAFWTWLQLMESTLNFESHRVYENEWTGGVPKIKRHKLILAEFPEHAKAIGKRHDITDAIGLGLWFLAHRRMLESLIHE